MPIKHALVVDDSKSVLIMLRRMLEQISLAVDTVESAEEALEYLRSKRPDVIFMDHTLPGMNGLDATKRITGDPATAAIPVVMHTTKDGEAFVKQAEAHGAAGVLPKPAQPNTLTQVLQALDTRPKTSKSHAAVPARESAAPIPSAAAQATPAATIESIARGAVESVVNSAVQSLVTRLLDEQIGQLKQDLLARARIVAADIAAETAADTAKQVAGPLIEAMRAQTSRMHLLAGAAGMAGVVAVLAYLLR